MSTSSIDSRPTFKITCPLVDRILFVRNYNKEELKAKYDELKKRISELKEPVKLSNYMLYIVKTFLHKYKDFEASLPQQDDKADERQHIVTHVYGAILELFPLFAIEHICTDINHELYFSGMAIEDKDNSTEISDILEDKETEIKGIRTLADVEKVRKYLSKRIIGQDEAIGLMVNGIKLVASGLRPRTSYFFLGKTGVGKTLAAKLFGQKYSGNFYRVNCNEFISQHEINKLLGSPPGYIGSTEKSALKEKAEKSNKWVFLWDEIEKAPSKLYDLLLSLLDEGKITDNNGKELDFSRSVHIFTSNIGVSDIKIKSVGFTPNKVTWENSHDEIEDAIKKQFKPEFINRIDNFVYFNSLTTDDVNKIVSLELNKLPVERSRELIEFIVNKAYSPEYGAREIDRFITKYVATEIADAILDKKVPIEGKKYKTSIIDNKIRVIDLKDYESKKIEINAN